MISRTLFVPLLLVLGRARAAIDSLNLAEYQELCKFIQILETEPEIPKIIFDGAKEDITTSANELLSVIEILNASTTEEAVFELLERGVNFGEASANPVVKNMGDGKWAHLVASWKSNKEKKQEDPTKVAWIPNTQACVTAHRRIGEVLMQAQIEANKIQKLESLMKTNVYEARKHMFFAIYGKEAVKGQLPDKGEGKPGADSDQTDHFSGITAQKSSFGDGSGGYEKVCGGDGTATKHPGTSIVSDMTCLCASKNAGNNDDFCGADVDAPEALTSDFDATKLPAAGNAYKQKCSAVRNEGEGKLKPSPESLQGIIARLKGMLGSNSISGSSASFASGYTKNSQFILGAFVKNNVGATKCEGTASLTNTAQTGVCVNYAALLTNKKKEIPWIDEVQEASRRLKENENHFAVQLSLLHKLELLKSKAETYYENALYAPQGSEPSVGAVPKARANGTQGVYLSDNEKQLTHSGSPPTFRISLPSTLVILPLLLR